MTTEHPKMTSPAISVAMPVYNAEPYVALAVESVLGQTFRDFEFIIINDGSTDRSKEIIEKYAQSDRRIRLVSRENRGLVASLNEGLAMSRGEFIARMDADDICLPERFSLQAQFMHDHPDCVAVGSRSLFIDAWGRELCVQQKPMLTHDEIDKAHFNASGSRIFHPSAMIRREPLISLGGYRDWPIGEDYDLWLRLAEIGRLANMCDVLIKYRFLSTSYSRAKRDLRKNVTSEILAEAYQRRNLVGIPSAPAETMPFSKAQFSIKCARYALRGANFRTARMHAHRAVFSEPLNSDGWKIVFDSYFGINGCQTLRSIFRFASRRLKRCNHSNSR